MSLELHHDFTFNPDGSGRVTVRWSGPGGAGAPSPDDFVRSELERCQGVEAWADVQCGPEDDRLVFSGTAWFRDITALRFFCQGFHVSLLDFQVLANPDGGITVAAQGLRRDAAPTLAADATPAEVRASLASEREKMAGARGFLAELFGNLVCRAVLRLPGPLLDPVPGERIDANAVQVEYHGAKLVTALDRLLDDDAALERMLRTSGASPEAALELLGESGPVELTTGPDVAPAFDFEAEVAMAREAFAAFSANLQVAAPADEPAELLPARVLGCKLVFEADGSRDLAPFGQNFTGASLSIGLELPVAALDIEDACYTRAVADCGTDVTTEDEWNRRVHFPKRTTDGGTVCLEFNLAMPQGSRGLAELHGRFVALTSDGSEDQDLGFAELTAGAAGTVHGAQLVAANQEDENRWSFEILVHVAQKRILGCRLVGDDGELALEQSGYSSCNDETTMNYRAEGTLPANARMVMTFASELRRRVYGFELGPIDWFGRPLS